MSNDVADPNSASCRDCRSAPELELEFTFAFQPIVDTRRESVFSYEALVRGTSGESAAWVLGQVNDGNRYRFDQACRVRALTLASRLRMTTRININFLPHAIYRPEVCLQTTLRAAAKLQFPIDRIQFEIVESEKVADDGRLTEIVHEYRRLGFSTAIDDFGAGYAGLNLLADFQPDYIKLDMKLVRGVDSSNRRQDIVRSLIALCRQLSIGIIAEGVETSEEYRWLFDAGISLFQGYYFARPLYEGLPVVAFADYRRRRALYAVPADVAAVPPST